MKKRIISVLILGAAIAGIYFYASSLHKEVEEVKEPVPIAEEPQFEYEPIEYDWGIIFREIHSGEEITFTYDAPQTEWYHLLVEEKEIHITDPEDPYYITELPLQQDKQNRSTREICEEIGPMYNLDPEYLVALCLKESNCNPDADNGTDKGITQVNPNWHKERMKRLEVTDLKDPYQCVLVSADFIAELRDYALTREDVYGNMLYVFMRYNMTIEGAEKIWAKGEVTDYAVDIIRMYNQLVQKYGRRI